MDTRNMWVAIARGDGPDPLPVAICRDPLIVRLALMRAREELDCALAETPTEADQDDRSGAATAQAGEGGRLRCLRRTPRTRASDSSRRSKLAKF